MYYIDVENKFYKVLAVKYHDIHAQARNVVRLIFESKYDLFTVAVEINLLQRE